MFSVTSFMPARRASMFAASSLLAALATTAPACATTTWALAEMNNEWDYPSLDPQTHTTGPSGIEWDFAGDATRCIPAQLNDGWTNPWQAWHDANPALVVRNTSIMYNAGGGYTSVTLSGSPLAVPAPADKWHGGTFTGPTWGNDWNNTSHWSYHSGVNAGYQGQVCPNNPVIWKRWIYKIGKTIQYVPLPLGGVSWPGEINQKNIKQAQAAVFYLETTDPAITGTWYWRNYVPSPDGTPPTFLYTNNGQDAITLGVAGIQTGLAEPKDTKCLHSPRCKENQAILDTLSALHYPPPNNDGSPMTALPQLQGVTLQPGESVKINLQ